MSEAERRRLLEAAAAEALRERMRESEAEIIAMSLVLEEERRRAEETLELLAAAEAAQEELALERDQALSAAEREAALRALASRTVDERDELTARQQRELAALNAQTAELRRQLAALSAQLEESEAAEAEAEVQIAALGQRLNAALAREAALQRREAERLRREVEDLASYRSEFFGRMREILADREDIVVVGDRFRFQSEVLFAFGSAELGPDGRAQLSNLAGAIREVIPEIPRAINWVLQVDGHTDDVGDPANNWRLSQDRARAVVRFLIDEEGLPPARLSANGFGQYQPLIDEPTAEARARNRRIEVKFTER
jgi:chemotaxis protein MotB